GVERDPAGAVIESWRLPAIDGATEAPLKSAVVAEGEKNPPVSETLTLPPPCETLSGVTATMAARVGFTVSASGPGEFGLPFFLSTEIWSCPAWASKFEGMVARSNVLLRKVVGTAAAT